MPRLYREAPLNSIWEGSGNVNALDVLRALAKEPDRARGASSPRSSSPPAPTRASTRSSPACATSSPTSRRRGARAAHRREARARAAGLAARPQRAARGRRRVLRLAAGRRRRPGLRHAAGRGRRARDRRAAHAVVTRPLRASLAMTLGFREAGDAGAPVALLLHGYPNSSYLWKDVLPAVADAGWRAVAPDFAGFGDSPLDARGAARGPTTSRALDDFVAHHGLAPVALVAHDWGGLIGLRWACERPVRGARAGDHGHRASSPTASGTGWPRGCGRRARASRSSRASRARRFGELLRSASPSDHRGGARRVLEGLRRTTSAAPRTSRCTAPATSRSSRSTTAASARWACRRCCCGATTTRSRRSAARTASSARSPHAELVVLEGVGHFVQEDAPERVAAEIWPLPRVRSERVFGERSIQLVRIAGIRDRREPQLVHRPLPRHLVAAGLVPRARSAEPEPRRTSPRSPPRSSSSARSSCTSSATRSPRGASASRSRASTCGSSAASPSSAATPSRPARSSGSRPPGPPVTLLIVAVCFGADRAARRASTARSTSPRSSDGVDHLGGRAAHRLHRRR